MNIDIPTQAIGAAKFVESMRGRESLSGPGSTLASTSELRRWLPLQIAGMGTKSLADAPCGDYGWMKSVDLGSASYSGYDLSESLISANKAAFPGVDFRQLNLLSEPIERADLVVSRDFLVHLTFEHAATVLETFRASGSKYLGVTTFPGVENRELELYWPGWGWRPLDMERAPFWLGEPLAIVSEQFVGWDNRAFGIYEL